MINTVQYSWKILKNTKGFLSSMLVMPIVMIILVSLTLAYAPEPMVGYVGVPGRLDRIPGIRITPVSPDAVEAFLAEGQGALVVHLPRSGQASTPADVQFDTIRPDNALIPVVLNGLMNPADQPVQHRPSVQYAMGVLLFKCLTAAGVVATVIISEKKSNVFSRIRNAGMSFRTYVLGKSVALLFAYILSAAVIALFYWAAGFDFGQSSPLIVFALLCLATVLSLGVYTAVTPFLKDEGSVWSLSTLIFFPMAVFSGALFPYETMPQWMQAVGRICPQHYLAEMAKRGTLNPVQILIMLAAAAALFLFGSTALQRQKH